MTTRPLLVLFSLAVSLQAAATARVPLPEPGDPRALVDLRSLARPLTGERFVVDTLSSKPSHHARASKRPVVLADIAGPGVLDHFMCREVGEITLTVDGEELFRSAPQKDWKPVYPAPKPSERGRLPFAFPLVQLAGPYAHCVLPIPFRKQLRLTSTAESPKVWLAGRRLPAPPKMTFSTDSGSPYMRSLEEAYRQFGQPIDRLPDYPHATRLDVEGQCPVRQRVVLAEIPGPAELVGLRLRIQPGALELLRYQVIELTIDGTTSAGMPLVDFLGVSHPWPHAWFRMAGDWAAGIVHPVYYGGGWREPAIVAYWKLPVPFREGLRIAIRNRSAGLPVTVQGTLSIVPLAHTGGPAGRLCGTSRRLGLRSKGAADLLELPAPGRLVGLSLFTTGHGPDSEWRRENSVQLVDAGGILTEGAGLLPFALQGISGNVTFESLTWNHNSFEPTGRCGAARHLWIDPLPFGREGRLRYAAAGKDGPTRAEAGILWYQAADAPPYAAPEVPNDVEPLPPVVHRQPGKPLAGGWACEAESLAAAAEASRGTARAETVGAKDAFASCDAYLAWNAEHPGDVLDLVVPMPDSRYVRLWYHRLLFPAGGLFRIELAAADEPMPRPSIARDEADFQARVLGQARAPASIDCYDFWAHRQAYRFDMPVMLNPAPGRQGRIRFVLMSKQRDSRGYLLAIDQIGLDPAPPTPEGWHEMESARVFRGGVGVTARRMPYGRPDFHGWGGLQFDAQGPSSITVSLVHSTASPPGRAIELRGIVESGEWGAQIEGSPAAADGPSGRASDSTGRQGARGARAARIGDGPLTVTLTAGETDKPTQWSLPCARHRDGKNVLDLRIHARSREGRLLLDGWRLAPASTEPP